MFPSLSLACFPLPFFDVSPRRFFSIDITPFPAPDRENWEIQSDPTIREIFLLVAFVLPPLQTALPTLPRRYSLYSFLRGRRQRTTERRQRGFCDHAAQAKGEMREIILAVSVPRGRYIDNREYPHGTISVVDTKTRIGSPRGKVLFTADCI
jgi:hypothetical protein